MELLAIGGYEITAILRPIMEKPTLPKGTRDFGPAVMAKRQFIFDTIKGVFQRFGFQPLETPSMENLSTLTGKYGDEGDQLLFKIVDSGDYFEKMKQNLASAQKMARIKDSLFDFLKELSKEIFRELPDSGTRNIDDILEIYKDKFDKINYVSGRQLKQ